MADPLLSTLCSICHISVPRYCCPRCSLQTCSLACSRRHKLWSSCNGIRDPTAFKPKSELATPSGVDHDYNFLHSIEHKIERSEKEIVLERMLISKEELEKARMGGTDDWQDMRRRKRQKPGEECMERMLRAMNTRVDRAPKGMKRNVENTTSWSRKRRTIHWQVEWIRMDGTGRSLFKALNDDPIGEVHTTHLEEEERKPPTGVDPRVGTKRKGYKHRLRVAKKRRIERIHAGLNSTAVQVLPNPETGAWNSSPAPPPAPAHDQEATPGPAHPPEHDFRLYLLRPYTPSNFPKVLVPLDLARPLSRILQFRIVLEFPTIYVQEHKSDDLPPQFMLERDYCARKTGEIAPMDSDVDVIGVDGGVDVDVHVKDKEHRSGNNDESNDDDNDNSETQSGSESQASAAVEDTKQDDGESSSTTSSSGSDDDDDDMDDGEDL